MILEEQIRIVSEEHARLIGKALLIRRFEQTLLKLYTEGLVEGTVHTCIGQEWSGVAVSEALEPDDIVFSNHRGHGHFLARYSDPDSIRALLAEIMGRQTGLCGGVGGTQHLTSSAFYSNGIQGGMVPIAAGAAFQFKLMGKDNVSVVFIGDGTLGQGIVYESLNIASKWELPLLVVIENNGYAQSTPTDTTIAGSIENRAAAFDIHFFSGETSEWKKLLGIAAQAAAYCRSEMKPAVLEIRTYRLNAHSKGDDTRDNDEIERHKRKDLLFILAEREPSLLRSLEEDIDRSLEDAIAYASASPRCSYAPLSPSISKCTMWRALGFNRERHVDLIYKALRKGLESDPRVVIIGEDIEGPYGGAFKVTKDLSLLFPGRVRNTPISEASIVGMGTGLAVTGMLPVVEIMFGDFLTLTFDQLYQHAAKFHDMYNGRCRVPLIVRTPMGGRRGYGPTHSQSIEKFFLGIPGLRVVALNYRLSPGFVYEVLLEGPDGPVLVIESKVLYTRFIETKPPPGFTVEFSDEALPTVRIRPSSGKPDLTIVCYGEMLEEAEGALNNLFDRDEILCEILCCGQLYPLNVAPILESVSETGRLLVIEGGPTFAGFGAEVISQVVERSASTVTCARLGYDGVIPASMSREKELLPSAPSIVEAARRLL